MIVDEDGFALAYVTWGDPMFRRLDRFGGLRGPATQIRDTFASDFHPAVERSASGYGYVWFDSLNHDHVFQHLDSSGAISGSPVVITEPDIGAGGTERASMVWMGSEFLVASESVLKIWLLRLDEDGNRIAPPIRIDQDPSNFAKNRPSLVWNGVHPAVAWNDSRTQDGLTGRIVFSRQTCCEDVARPALVTGLSWQGPDDLVWNPNGAPRYDRVLGSLDTLRSVGGYESSVSSCANDLALPSSTEPDLPPPESGAYYLVRGDSVCWAGSYDDGTQSGSRDPGINASPAACP